MAAPVKNWVRGTDLTEAQREQARSLYVNRFTGEHTPDWRREEEDSADREPMFPDDATWLAAYTFPVRRDGQLGHAACRPYRAE